MIGVIRTIPTILKNLGVENAGFVEEYMKRWSIYFDMVFSHISLALILVMSFERMLALVQPFKVKRTWFAKFPLGIIFCVFLFVNIIFLLPFIIYLEVALFTAINKMVYFIQFNPAVKEDLNRYHIAQTVVDYFIPAVCLPVTNITIPIKYYRVTQSRKTTFNETSRSFASRQMKVTSTVFAVTFMYFLLSVPNLTIKILGFVDTDYSFDGKQKLVFWFAIDLSNLFTISVLRMIESSISWYRTTIGAFSRESIVTVALPMAKIIAKRSLEYVQVLLQYQMLGSDYIKHWYQTTIGVFSRENIVIAALVRLTMA